MARLIDADEFERFLMNLPDEVLCEDCCYVVVNEMRKQPTIDPVKHGYVLSGVLDQVRWERDVAIDQLKSYGIGLGEKAKVKKVVEGYWIPIEADGYADGYPVWEKWECSICGNELNCDEDGLPAYCCGCGAEMSIPGPEYWEDDD